ncbi:IS66 family insertion sequence element accessory protein TnpB [Pedobacter ginsengisoli]|uniref:IS66 family insertion sequence element accessory protein TnpB n=1 Tax=Pedobacter ginsengisoli TaxID=363852 RepID=UPI00254CDE2C|nr:IS66 family insertion sequence element accessory protein TnpB [Pedobacter ginsengisoli]
MEKLIKLTNNEIFKMFIGDKPFRVYNKEVDRRLGMPGLSKLVLKVTGNALKEDEAYVFCVRNQNAVKILSRDYMGISMAEVYDLDAAGIKEEFVQLGQLK